MKVSDYIVSFLIERGITDVFGYPGGMAIHLMDSLSKQAKAICAHVCYHEQGAAFAACGYAQTSLKPGIAYTTSGPGATNLLTGVADAYFDSRPAIFITGQVNTYEGKGTLPLRQKGFQEMDVIPLFTNVTKYCVQITDAQDVPYYLEKAWFLATEGRPGPVVLDIPMNVQRAEISPDSLHKYQYEDAPKYDFDNESLVFDRIYEALSQSKRPCVLIGAGISISGVSKQFAEWIARLKVPVVSSMLAVDVLPGYPHYYGFIGAYGHRHANFILAKSDLIISLGSRLDLRQTGINTDNFAVNARLLRIDIDSAEFSHKVKKDEEQFLVDLEALFSNKQNSEALPVFDFSPWIGVCDEIRTKLQHIDDQEANIAIRTLSEWVEADAIVTTDVGQNQVWVAQSFIAKGQRILFSGGHGAMGFSLPAAIGAHYGSGGKKVISFNGDGGMQMNIQELQVLAREQIPVKIILLNNQSLGMIRHFQEIYFESNYVYTKRQTGYVVPDFGAISQAYGIPYVKVAGLSDIEKAKSYLDGSCPAFIEIALAEDTYTYPKLTMGKLNQDQEPALDRELFGYISNL